MATSMFSNSTSADRRKKVVTYGKSSRLSAVPAPARTSNDDAPSPDRPRKHTPASGGSLKKLGENLKPTDRSDSARTKTGSSNVFDVPSEDEFDARSGNSAKVPQTRHRKPTDDFDVPLSEDEAPVLSRRPVKAVQSLRKTGSTKTINPAVKDLQKPEQLPKSAHMPLKSSVDSIAARGRRGKTPQTKQDITNEQPRTSAKPKASSRATTPAQSTRKDQKNTKPALVPALKKASDKTLATKKLENVDVFDVPSSDEEASLSPRKPVRPAPSSKAKDSTKPSKATIEAQEDSVESDNSNASRKRKRKGSVSSVVNVKPSEERKPEPSLPQRSRKYQKHESSKSPGHASPHQQAVAPISEVEAAIPAINKPKRTRLRTVPVLSRPAISKGQSSPATLNRMLPAHTRAKPSPIAEAPEVTALEDETMYEITNPVATPVRPSKMATPGSVTPRQKALFNSLLGESSSSKTPMPSISALHLTDRKPKSLLGALSRSKSDLTYSAATRRTRLIDTIKRAQSSSDDEDEDESTSSSVEDLEQGVTNGRTVEKPSINPRTSGHAPDAISDDMDIDEITTDSQTSQVNSSLGTRSRLTYAKARSYLQEANPEDDLLISMDLDDNLEFNKDTISEEEEDPASQVQAHHELKRQGQQKAFYWEAEMSIDDISNKTSNSIRRSAMLELCTKMADTTFTSQLLDSSLAHQFFTNITSNGEIIFDFATAVAVIFVLRVNPNFTVLEQIRRTSIVTALVKLAGNEVDIQRIAKDRKTNLSKIAQESVIKFRTTVQKSPIWLSTKPDILSPQLVSLKALDSLILGLRKAGSSDSLIDQADIPRLVGAAAKPSERVKSGKGSTHDTLVINSIISILEADSVARQRQPVWSSGNLQHLADFLPVFFEPGNISSTMLAVKLCMNLTNNKPKACQPFARTTFVQPLVASIIHNFGLLHTGLGQEQRMETLESLILSLGAMINLAELSDTARLNVDDGGHSVDTLVQIFLEGSERASQADSMEESQTSVAVGYLTVLLGNLCLNSMIRSRIRTHLPGQRLDTLIDKIKEFVRFHEHVDSKAKQFEGEEGQETWQNYTARLMLVVEKLEKAEA
ncbi:hypothetical protein N0V83_007621 [Neocucurbitaria cava]|uniref:Wings apart-like protein C-terminal domain-containing protein n=1 Tax=Neocucurbitaria cava TaxID=798079 RepID=A0A9W8Y3Q2_9PLEO|nr:hypothetical protein N0V83_007621 [Neocucurbitaria cava]